MLTDFLGSERLAPYLEAAKNDPARAADLYQWNMQLCGALHVQISYVEIAARNSIDRALRTWNAAQSPSGAGASYGPEWTTANCTAEPLFGLVRKSLNNARTYAKKESKSRHQQHPRYDVEPTHDDLVAQLTFGAWTLLFTDNLQSRRERLWDECLRHAFPNADQTQVGQEKVGRQMEVLRRLRNRAAHHENVLEVNATKALNTMLSLLKAIDEDFPQWVMAGSWLRRLAREDPRNSWK